MTHNRLSITAPADGNSPPVEICTECGEETDVWGCGAEDCAAPAAPTANVNALTDHDCPDCGHPLRSVCPSCQGRRGKGVTTPRKSAASRANVARAREAAALRRVRALPSASR